MHSRSLVITEHEGGFNVVFQGAVHYFHKPHWTRQQLEEMAPFLEELWARK